MTDAASASIEAVVADAACPRCGHSQRGILHPEAEAWPLTTACSECGLEIRWSEYVESQFDLPVAWVEHAPWRRWLLAVPLTVLASLVGWPLWGRMRLAHPPRLGRLFVAVVIAYLLCLGGLVVTRAAQVMSAAAVSRFAGQTTVIVLQGPAGEFVPCEARWREPTPWERFAALKPILTQPLSGAPMAAPSSFSIVRRVDEGEGIAQGRWGRRYSGIVVPLATPIGATLPESVPFLPPATGGWWGAAMASPLQFWLGAGEAAWFPFGFVLSLVVIGTATFIVLPIARRRAKVRWVHVVRAGLYSALGPALLSLGLAVVLGLRSPHTSRDIGNLLLFSIFLAPSFLLHTVWWWLAAGPYLRMGRPLAVGASVGVIAVLGAAAMAIEVL